MKAPIVMPHVDVRITEDGRATINVDGRPHDTGSAIARAHVRGILEQLAVELGTPIRVEVHEHDGDTFTDIVMPPTDSSDPSAANTPGTEDNSECAAAGFLPGEELVFAYVVARPHADTNGKATLHIPPALLALNRDTLLLLGPMSGTIANLS